MLRNCEKMSTSTPPISSTTNMHQWPQNQKSIISSSSSPSSSNNKFMDHKSSQDPLKCPRCDSSNTKFCYYNNYSLSQPRHFCKACKRYWTRGGTLRNVPVGGGCRKNKRVKRPAPPATSNGSDGLSSAPVAGGGTATIKPSVQPEIDLSNNPFFYGLPTNPLELNFPFSRFGTTRVSSESSGMLDQFNGLGLGFSIDRNDDYRNGFKDITSSSSSILAAAENSAILFGSSNFAPSSTMANLLVNGGLRDIQESSNFPGLMPYEDVLMGKEVKMEGQNGLEWNPNPIRLDQINPPDSSSVLWNPTNSGAWFDPSNMGSSVPSLI